jgi:hypothetical protein
MHRCHKKETLVQAAAHTARAKESLGKNSTCLFHSFYSDVDLNTPFTALEPTALSLLSILILLLTLPLLGRGGETLLILALLWDGWKVPCWICKIQRGVLNPSQIRRRGRRRLIEALVAVARAIGFRYIAMKSGRRLIYMVDGRCPMRMGVWDSPIARNLLEPQYQSFTRSACRTVLANTLENRPTVSRCADNAHVASFVICDCVFCRHCVQLKMCTVCVQHP